MQKDCRLNEKKKSYMVILEVFYSSAIVLSLSAICALFWVCSSRKLINSINKHDIYIGRSTAVDLALSLAWSLRIWNTCGVQHSLWYLRSFARASFGDVALLNLVINTGSLEISTACLRAFPEFIVLTEKRTYLLSNLQKKHSTFDKRSVADLVNGFDVPGVSASISKVDLLWRRLFIAYCPVATKCSKWSLTHCNSV